MANLPISDLPGISAGNDAMEFAVNDAGASKKITGAQVFTYITTEVDGLTSQTLLEDANVFALRDGTDNKKTTALVMGQYIDSRIRGEKNFSDLLIENSSVKDIDISYTHMYIGPFRDTQVTPEVLDVETNANWGSGTAAEPTSGIIFIWNWAKADGTVKQFFDLSGTSPSTPTDYVYSKLIGYAINDSGNDIINFKHVDDRMYFIDNLILSSFTLNSWTALNISTFAPATIAKHGEFRINRGTGGTSFYLASDSNLYGQRGFNFAASAGSIVTIRCGIHGTNIYYYHESGDTTGATLELAEVLLKI